MKKIVALFAFVSFVAAGPVYNYAQESAPATENPAPAVTDSNAPAATPTPDPAATSTEDVATAPAKTSVSQDIKRYFVEGGPEFMALVIISLIIGLAVAIERIIYLNLSATNSEKLLSHIEGALKSGGVNAAKEICRSTPGPVAGIFLEGLNRSEEGIEMVEKTVISYGGVEMNKLEKGLPWLSLMIALAPMLGFLGTVIGMIQAFDAIAAAGDINPTVVASGIKVALITTVGGLIVAIILQILYNYLLSKIESIVGDMEEASISFIDVLVKNKVG